MRLTLIMLCSLLLAACSPDPDTKMNVEAPQSGSRISVTRIGVVRDTIAYSNVRGIYLIKDSVTGSEYIGVSGVGISELGRHSAGKSTVSDER